MPFLIHKLVPTFAVTTRKKDWWDNILASDTHSFVWCLIMPLHEKITKRQVWVDSLEEPSLSLSNAIHVTWSVSHGSIQRNPMRKGFSQVQIPSKMGSFTTWFHQRRNGNVSLKYHLFENGGGFSLLFDDHPHQFPPLMLRRSFEKIIPLLRLPNRKRKIPSFNWR